jgi:hypothetical protein
MNINSLPSYTSIARVMLPDGEWYQVSRQSFMAEGDSFHFTGNHLHKSGTWEYHGPLSSLKMVAARPQK